MPRTIFFDAVGTLFEVRGTVGNIYAQFAAEYDVEVSESVINQSFLRVFKAASEPAFGVIDSKIELELLERNWWRQIVFDTFLIALETPSFNGFDEFFDRVYNYFSTSSAWSLYPEVFHTLTGLKEQGIQLGVISNFDSRLLNVLQCLDLASFFQSVTLSSHVGFAKPSQRIFQVALSQNFCEAHHAIHIGDQVLDDYHGSRLAGLHGIWINRERRED